MHADITQENNLTHAMQRNLSTVSEPSEMKPNLVDQTCELFKWLCNYRQLQNSGDQFWLRQRIMKQILCSQFSMKPT